jgi:broad specificity phosphatase PhoE
MKTTTMRQIVLVHAGATEYAKQGRIQGTLDVPLSEDGKRQAENVATALAELKPTILYSAPGLASQQTAQVISDRFSLKLRTLDKLTNVNQGLWQGLLVDDVKTKQPKVFRQWLEHPEMICPPEGESVSKARERVSEVLTKLTKKLKPDAIAVLVAPDPLACVIRHVLSGAEFGDLWHCGTQAGRWETFELDKPAVAAVDAKS